MRLTFAVLLGCWCLVLVFAANAFAQYSIDWSTIDGGGASTGGMYSVSGTIGQTDAGAPMRGGNYSLVGGFWLLFAVQTPGGPLLTIRLTTTHRRVSSTANRVLINGGILRAANVDTRL